MKNKAFTLIELLVVVLIIGILAAIALPKYEKAVWKSRLAEVMINVKTIENCYNEYVLTNGLPADGNVYLKDMGCGTELSGGSWIGNEYKTKYFVYRDLQCTSSRCNFLIFDQPAQFGKFELQLNRDATGKRCFTNTTSLGRIACQMFALQGFEYKDEMWD